MPPEACAQGEQPVAGIVRQPDLGLMIANDLHEIGHERLVQPERRAHVLQLGASMSLVVRQPEPRVHGVHWQLEAACDGAGHGAESAVHVPHARIERVVEIEDDCRLAAHSVAREP